MKEEGSIKESLAYISKKFGEGAIMRLGDKPNREIEAISTTCPSLDKALGIGGFPRGRIIEIYGQESSGKTTLALHVIASAQKAGGLAAFIDAEHALDPSYAKKLGVATDDLLVSQPSSGEEALEIAEALVRSNEVAIIVVDSVAALVPQAEINGEMGDASMGLQARLMSQAMRKLTSVVSESNTCLIFINQLRDKIGVVWGSPTVTTGGKALKFYASVRIDIARIGQVKDGNEKIIGSKTRVKIVKNKVGPPFRECEFDIIYNHGISIEGDVIDSGVKSGVIQQKGSWFSYGDVKLGQGREKVRELFQDNPELMAEIVTKL